MSGRDLPEGVVVAIPTYNRAAKLDRAVRSVLAQQHRAVTVIVSDDAATDGTPEVCRTLAEADARVFVHRHERNLGLTANYNWVMRQALSHDPLRHGFFMFLPDDDWIDPDYIRLCIEKLRTDRGHSMVAGRTRAHDERQSSWYAPDVNIEDEDPVRRVGAFCRDVVPTGIMSGVMPLDIVSRLPPQRNVVGNDWLLLINVVFLGRIATVPATAVNRSADGASSSLRDLTSTLGVSRHQAAKPLMTVGFFLLSEYLYRSPVFAALPLRRRLHVLAVSLAGFLMRRAGPPIRTLRAPLQRATGGECNIPCATSAPLVWATVDLEEVTRCPACGGAKRRTLYSNLRDQVFEIAGGTWTMMCCETCTVGFLSPRPAPHALERAYAGGYYTHEPLSPDESAVQPGRSARSVRIRNAYLNRRFGFDLAPTSNIGIAVATLSPRFRAAEARQVRHLSLPQPGARLLDVGCGSGGFVARARTLGWSARGIDIDGAAVERGLAAGVPLAVRTIEDEAARSGPTFDAVTMEHVLEHVPDPLAFLCAAQALLRPGGALWIATPNLHSSAHRRFGRSWKHLDPPRHLVIFTGETLDDLLRRAGFSSVTPLTSASGTIATYIDSALIEQGRSPFESDARSRAAGLRGRVAGLRALVQRSTAEEIVRMGRIDS